MAKLLIFGPPPTSSIKLHPFLYLSLPSPTLHSFNPPDVLNTLMSLSAVVTLAVLLKKVHFATDKN